MEANFSNNTELPSTNSNWSVLILIVFILLTIVGNCLVCLSIIVDRRLRNVTNCFLFSLAVADLLVAVLVMPFGLLVEFDRGHWRLGFTLCAFYSYSDVFLCSVSIVHMTVISLDRYSGVSSPLKIRRRSNSEVALKILAIWLITFLICSPFIFVIAVKPDDVFVGGFCQISNEYFMIYGSVAVFVIPTLIMLIIYASTVRLLKLQTAYCAPSSELRKTTKRTIRKFASQPALRTLNSKEDIFSRDSNVSATDLRKDENFAGIPQFRGISSDGTLSKTRNSLENVTVAKFRRIILQKARQMSESAELANEKKATRVLGIVFACFVICWTPFFVLNFFAAFCGDFCRSIPSWLTSAFLWLGYLSSTVNPFIYTTFSRRFRLAFRDILFCHCFFVNVRRK